MNNIESLPEDPDPYDFERDQIDYPSLPPGLIPPTSGSRFAPSINTRALLPTIEELSESREPSPTHSSPDAPVIPPGLEGLTLSSTQLMQTRNAEGNQHSFTIHHTSIDSTNGPERHSLSSDITKVSKNEAEGKGEGEFVAVSVHPVEEGTSEAGHNIGEVQVEPSARRVSVIGAESMILGEKDLAPRKSWSFWLPFVAINISIFISAMSFMAIGTVLPTIAHSLDDRRGDFTWIGSAYALSMTAFIPLGGAVSDIFGRLASTDEFW
ncbi:hypothetical protein VKT23_009764 [Stygiomarasmius scandens]|uniref:Major facilitator superfamily (MFS) profile domain-containing protein n=1 Tax=Marasmiellus scandens TaxID=2682957 RepID=A0ABR1JIJ4_9AGAR